ncbi:TLD domain-containing protein [Quillaja saponaria]|uniref:TLD domain-containing protein n=1 Tax=Quillaja saponaria TaxID=32244 RepID=A0AAD7LYX5_QUISA|nr:TLD domain-containing protein [Quillaja saponaria]KAJ7966844.1 TLD domain-containing protein [Quillaja saponaria]
MGASTSSEQKVSKEQEEVESLAASTGALPMLQKAFSKLADPEQNSVPIEKLQQCFSLTYERSIDEALKLPDAFTALLDHLASSIVEQFFVTGKGGVTWVEFVRGYNNCCGRMTASLSLNRLFRVFTATVRKANMPCKLEFESDDADCKISGSFLPIDVLMLLWMCWTMSWKCTSLKSLAGKAILSTPDVNHLVLSAIISCAKPDSGLNCWDIDISSLEVQIPVGPFITWVLATLPRLPECLTHFFHARLQTSDTVTDELTSPNSSAGHVSSTTTCDSNLLTRGRAWAISLTLRSTMSEEILRACFLINGDGMHENLLYRSSIHGRGLNRFWSNIEGYRGPLLILVAAGSGDSHVGGNGIRKWIVVFHVFSSIGKEKNFVYSHLHPTGRVYEPHPKPVGISFGGSVGNERISIDEDFGIVTVRHHAVDKTYQPGSLFPDQGFLPVEALISEVEVWGLGGRGAKEVQNSHKKREELFTEQRRRIDLKTFANWEDSPEKMMMNMISDPNAVRREER